MWMKIHCKVALKMLQAFGADFSGVSVLPSTSTSTGWAPQAPWSQASTKSCRNAGAVVQAAVHTQMPIHETEFLPSDGNCVKFSEPHTQKLLHRKQALIQLRLDTALTLQRVIMPLPHPPRPFVCGRAEIQAQLGSHKSLDSLLVWIEPQLKLDMRKHFKNSIIGYKCQKTRQKRWCVVSTSHSVLASHMFCKTTNPFLW